MKRKLLTITIMLLSLCLTGCSVKAEEKEEIVIEETSENCEYLRSDFRHKIINDVFGKEYMDECANAYARKQYGLGAFDKIAYLDYLPGGHTMLVVQIYRADTCKPIKTDYLLDGQY